MKLHRSIPAAASLLLLCVSSCKDEEAKEISDAPVPKPVTEAKTPALVKKEAAPTKAQEQPAPSLAAEKSNDVLTDQKKLEGQSYYNEENLAEANGLIEKMSAEVKEQILTEMKEGSKVSAVKIARADSKTSLAVNKLTVELLAIEAGVSARF